MKIAENIDVIVYDFETIKGCFLASFYFPEEDRYEDFLINAYQNDLYKFVKFHEKYRDRYFVGFNNINFDSQVQEFILQEYDKWYDLDWSEICRRISYVADQAIEAQNYNLFPKYREDKLTHKQLDVPRVLHWFNENKRVSLKQAEFELRAETIENFEFDPGKEEFSEKEVQDLVYYCHNDVKYTYEILKYILGQTDHPLYKGKDKIQDRLNVYQEAGLHCLNWDDVKIGAEWNKKDYVEMTGKDERYLKPDKVNHFYGKKYKEFFPKTASFQSPELKKFMEEFGNTYIIRDKQEFKYSFNKKLTVTIARGGLHSNEGPRFLQPEEDEIFLQNDIGSQYPNALRKLQIFPIHLGPKWYEMLVSKIQRRLDYKSQYKKTKDPKFNSLQEMGKLSLNGGAFGRLNTQGDWQQDPCAMLKVTIGCQLEIMMIVEALILKGFNITSCNTDGWDCIIPKSRLDEYFGICEYYEELIGNKEMGQVEYTVFGWMAQTSVNDYIAEKLGVYENRKFKADTIVTKESAFPNMKLKGDFTIDFLLDKNSSFRVIPLALVNYYAFGTPVDEFINKHDDIFDFCARSNCSAMGNFYHADEQGNMLPKLIRYYVSKEGIQIKKRVKVGAETNASDKSISPSEKKKTISNRLPGSERKLHLSRLDREWYISKTEETIQKISRGKKTLKKVKIDPNQGSLFG